MVVGEGAIGGGEWCTRQLGVRYTFLRIKVGGYLQHPASRVGCLDQNLNGLFSPHGEGCDRTEALCFYDFLAGIGCTYFVFGLGMGRSGYRRRRVDMGIYSGVNALNLCFPLSRRFERVKWSRWWLVLWFGLVWFWRGVFGGGYWSYAMDALGVGWGVKPYMKRKEVDC